MTIKQLADQLGVTKSKVEYRLRKLPIEWVTVVDGVKHLNEDAINAITEELHEEKQIIPYYIRNDDALRTTQRIIELETENKLLREQVTGLMQLIERISYGERTNSGRAPQRSVDPADIPGHPKLGFLAAIRARRDRKENQQDD